MQALFVYEGTAATNIHNGNILRKETQVNNFYFFFFLPSFKFKPFRLFGYNGKMFKID